MDSSAQLRGTRLLCRVARGAERAFVLLGSTVPIGRIVAAMPGNLIYETSADKEILVGFLRLFKKTGD